ncbi:hypothetical protein Dimus_038802 [Dionaea muscipula]
MASGPPLSGHASSGHGGDPLLHRRAPSTELGEENDGHRAPCATKPASSGHLSSLRARAALHGDRMHGGAGERHVGEQPLLRAVGGQRALDVYAGSRCRPPFLHTASRGHSMGEERAVVPRAGGNAWLRADSELRSYGGFMGLGQVIRGPGPKQQFPKRPQVLEYS